MLATNSLSIFVTVSLAIIGFQLSPSCLGAVDKSTGIPTNVLYSGTQIGSNLTAGQSLVQDTYSLTMGKDCNLVLSDAGQTVWQTNTAKKGKNGCYLHLQSTGTLVINDKHGETLWSSGNGGEDRYYVLVLQKDRNLVVYGPPLWATGTNAP